MKRQKRLGFFFPSLLRRGEGVQAVVVHKVLNLLSKHKAALLCFREFRKNPILALKSEAIMDL